MITMHKAKRNASFFLKVILLPAMLLVTSFVLKEQNTSATVNNKDKIMEKMTKDSSDLKSKTEKVHTPFILNLTQNGTENVTTILDSTKSVQMKSGYVVLQPGENVGSHNTGEHEELLVILDGKGQIDAQGLGKKEVTGGMVAYMPPHNQHNVFCVGSVPFKYIYVVAPVE